MTTLEIYFDEPRRLLWPGMSVSFREVLKAYCATCRRTRSIHPYPEGDGCAFCCSPALYVNKVQHRAMRPAVPSQSPAWVPHTITSVDYETRTVTYNRPSAHIEAGGVVVLS